MQYLEKLQEGFLRHYFEKINEKFLENLSEQTPVGFFLKYYGDISEQILE